MADIKDNEVMNELQTPDGEFVSPTGKGALHETEECRALRAVTVGVFEKGAESDAASSLEELSRLLYTAGVEVAGVVTQMREKPDGKTCIGKGKLAELKEVIFNLDCDLAVFDCELTPSQIANIEFELENSVSVIDRSMLILDIFASRAVSAEGALQVELAQLKYTSPRLMGKGKAMSRTGGGIGTRGPGETKLEIDRRRLKARIHALENELEKLEAVRRIKRRERDRSRIAKCAIVGYTNAGKSTLLNRLTNAGILAEDKLFATLDPTTRQYELESGAKVLLTDTVGFIRNLPHHLIEAFKSTLDEAVYADFLMIVADASDPELQKQLEVTRSTLDSLGALGKPIIFVFNKCDKANDPSLLMSLKSLFHGAEEKCVFISAKTGEGIPSLSRALCDTVSDGKHTVQIRIPLSNGSVLSRVYSLCDGVTVEYGSEFIEVTAACDAESAGKLRDYIVNYSAVFKNVDDEEM